MKTLYTLFVFLSTCTSIGCAETPEAKKDFTCEVNVKKVNGNVAAVTVYWPTEGNGRCGTTVQSKENVDELIRVLESAVSDLKAIQDQMPTQESGATKPAPQPIEPKE